MKCGRIFFAIFFAAVPLNGFSQDLPADHICKDCSLHAVSPFIRSGTGAEKILLRNRILVPESSAGLQAVSAGMAEDCHLIFQFEPGRIEEGLVALRKRGIEVLEWVPNYAVSAKVPKGVSLSGLSDVRWAGALGSVDKLSRYLGAAQMTSSEHVIVDLFTGANPKKVAAALAGQGIETLSNPHLGSGSLLIKATKEDLKKIAGIDDVSYIFPASKEVIAGVPVWRCPGPMTEFGLLARFVTNGEGWDGQGQNAISLTYHFRNGTPDLTGEENIVVSALNVWSSYAQINWTETMTNNLTRSMDIQWGAHPSYPFDGPGGTLAYCFYPSPPNSEPVAGDCHFDDGETWTNNGGTSGFDLFSVALHESGHGLGLNHSDDPNAVMYPYYQYVTGLRPDDILGIRALYATTGGGGGGDSYEPDNSSGAARLITNGVLQSHSIVPATDLDWVYFDLSATLAVTLETSGSSGDTRMWLYNSALTEIEFDDDDGADLFSRIERTLTPGRYFVKIDEFDNNNEIPSYSLSLQHAGASGGDIHEPDNKTTNAKSISNGETQTRSIVPAADDDYVRFTLTGTTDVTISTDGAAGDTEMWLYGSNLSVIEFDDDSGTNLFSRIDRRAVDNDALPAGTYYILVDEYGDNNEIPQYTLNFTTGGAGGGDDAYEENDTLEFPKNHGFNWERTNLSSIAGEGIQADDDWYQIDVFPEGFERVAARADFSHAEGDIDLSLYDSSGNLLANSNEVSDFESIDSIVPVVGSYYLRVYFGDSSNLYDLWWDDLEKNVSGNRPPTLKYLSPAPRSILSTRRVHRGIARDDKRVTRVRYQHPGSRWRSASYSRSSGRWSFRPAGVAAIPEGKRWVRFSVLATDNQGGTTRTRRVFRQEVPKATSGGGRGSNR
jgi:hypothetical protein